MFLNGIYWSRDPPKKFSTPVSRIALFTGVGSRTVDALRGFGFTRALLVPYDALIFTARAFGLGCARIARSRSGGGRNALFV